MKLSKTHIYIPDTQVKPGVPLEYLSAIANYIIKHKPDVIIVGGDFADMPSLSSYDIGKKSFEGRTYKADIESVHRALKILMKPIQDEQERLIKLKKKRWNPRLVLTTGNHEFRVERAIEFDRKLEGLISMKDFGYEDYGFEVIPFLEPIVIDGISYCHYYSAGRRDSAISNAKTLLNRKHMSCIAGHKQGRDIAYGQRGDGRPITTIIAGSCLHPDHKILTADLRYIPLRELKVGDKIVSFDERANEKSGTRKSPRRFKTGTVNALRISTGEMYDVTLSTGKVFRVTKDHLWFTKNSGSLYSWRTTEQLRCTKESSIGKNGGGTRIVQLLDEFQHNNSWESGWLAGLYCGEGSLYYRKTSGGGVMQLSLSQSETHNPETCRRIENALYNICGVETDKNRASTKTVNNYRIVGGTRKIATVLGTIRPPRMIEKFKPEMLGGLGNKIQQQADYIVSIVPIGEDEYMEIDVDEKTMIIEGYGHHNCYMHDESYMGHQGNNHWRGILRLNDVKDGSFEERFISLDYLMQKYF